MRRMAVLLVAVSVLLCDPGFLAAQELTLSVAISMKEAVEEIGRRFVQSRSGVLLHYNFGGSGELQKQIEAGAPVDVFVSAARADMDELEGRGLVLAGTRRTFARNALVELLSIGGAAETSADTESGAPSCWRSASYLAWNWMVLSNELRYTATCTRRASAIRSSSPMTAP